MARKTWTVLNSTNNEYTPGTLEMDGDNGLKVRKDTLQCGLSAGVDLLSVSNGDFEFTVIPTRGMSIHSARFRDEFIGWKSPVRGPVHPAFVDVGEPSGLGWLDGFDELLVRCGLESNGAPEHDSETGRLMYPLHGRIGNKPAHQVTVAIDDEEITITGVVAETRFHFLKVELTSVVRLKVGERGFRIHDTVRNLSQSAAEIQMLYHMNFGDPLLDAGSQVIAPCKTIVPRNEHAAAGIGSWDNYEAAQPGFEEQVYFLELLADAAGETTAMLKNAHGTRGAALKFNTKQLPVFTVWKNTTAVDDGFVTGLEPGTNFPNPRTFEGEHGRVTKVGAGSTTDFHFGFQYLTNEVDVGAAETQVRSMQGSTSPTIHKSPQPDWCAP